MQRIILSTKHDSFIFLFNDLMQSWPNLLTHTYMYQISSHTHIYIYVSDHLTHTYTHIYISISSSAMLVQSDVCIYRYLFVVQGTWSQGIYMKNTIDEWCTTVMSFILITSSVSHLSSSLLILGVVLFHPCSCCRTSPPGLWQTISAPLDHTVSVVSCFDIPRRREVEVDVWSGKNHWWIIKNPSSQDKILECHNLSW